MLRLVFRLGATAVAIAAAVYLAAAGYLFVFQRDYVFKPGGTLVAPEEKGLAGVERVDLQMADGTHLAGWFAAAAPGLPTLLYFHGNAGNVSGRADRFRQVLASGIGLLAMSYRGYPGSGGDPSEAVFFSDALEIFDWLGERTPDVVVYGESLGTAVATHVAANREARALVLEAPFTAALDIAAATYPWLPVGLLMHDPFLTREDVQRVAEPLLILHGTEDRTVPLELGKALYELANEPKRLVLFEEAGHGNLWDNGSWPSVMEFLQAEKVIGPR